jgi:hypothetical protein
VNPALRQARRCADDALELGEHARTVLDQGLARLRADLDGQQSHRIEDVVDALASVRTRLGTAAERVTALPERITAAQVRLAATAHSPSTIASVTDHWTDATAQLRLMATSLADTIRALTTYADGLTGPTDELSGPTDELTGHTDVSGNSGDA